MRDSSSRLSREAEIPCVVLYPHKVEASYINDIVRLVRECLYEKGLKAYLLSDSGSSNGHFLHQFEKIVDECVIGIVILDGFRPDLLYEYGFFRGKGKLIVPIQDKRDFLDNNAKVAPIVATENVDELGNHFDNFELAGLGESPLNYFYHLSRSHGISTTVVDSAADRNSTEHTRNKLAKEIEALMSKVVERYCEESLKPVSGIGSDEFDELRAVMLSLLDGYRRGRALSLAEIDNAVEVMKGLEESYGERVSQQLYRPYLFLAHLYCRRVEADSTNPDEDLDCYKRAKEIYERMLEFEWSILLSGHLQKKLGDVYLNLSEHQDIEEYCKKAVRSYHEALKFYTVELFPIDYADIQNNLGVSYDRLAEIEDKSENCKRAIEAYQEALRFRTRVISPMDYALTQDNLGMSYRVLAEDEDKSENCRKAIAAHEEALKVYTYQEFPLRYSEAVRDMGNVYRILSESENEAGNCKRAIEMYKKALTFYTLAEFPIDYADIQNNLGISYDRLAEIENKSENCKRAIEAYQEALRV
jgi:tetratricopeptide (TPR) repeat protein